MVTQKSTESLVKSKRLNWLIIVSVVFLLISIVLVIVALAVPEWVKTDVTTTPDDYLGHSDIEQRIGLFRTSTEVCCLGQWTFDSALNYCGAERCKSNNGNTDDHVCGFVATMNNIRPVDFSCQTFKDGIYTTITFLFFVLAVLIGAVVVAFLRLNALIFPSIVAAGTLLAMIPIIVFPLVSYKEVKDFYEDRFPPVVAGYTYRNVYSIGVELGAGYFVMVFCFVCCLTALIFAGVGAWKVRKDEAAARRKLATYVSPGYETPKRILRPVDNHPPPVPVVVQQDPAPVYVQEQPANPIDSMLYTTRPASPLTRNNVQYNDFVHRVDGTFA